MACDEQNEPAMACDDQDEPATCPVCMSEDRPLIDVLPCSHSFCYDCVLKWIGSGRGGLCPLCREVILGLGASECTSPPTATVRLRVVIHPGEHAGITLRNAKDGVLVARLHPKDAARSHGLCPRDVIMQTNRVPCTGHDQAVRMWNRLADRAASEGCAQQVVCDVRRAPPHVWGCCPSNRMPTEVYVDSARQVASSVARSALDAQNTL